MVGVDLAPKMVEEARALLPVDLAGRVRFEVGDASSLEFEPGAFDLVVLLNMIPFFEELARVTAPGGTVLFAFSSGPETPIYVPTEKLRERLEPLGFEASRRSRPVPAPRSSPVMQRDNRAVQRFNLNTGKLDYDESDPEGFRAGMARFGASIGATMLGGSLYELPPGQSNCPYHYEYGNEEWLIVLEGEA